MTVSVFDLFSIGIGPSSSHTVGPMTAGADFVELLRTNGVLPEVASIGVTLYGSLAATGKGHGTFGAVLLGLDGHRPALVSPATVTLRLEEIAAGQPIRLGGDGPSVHFQIPDIELRPHVFLPRHSNAMQFRAYNSKGELLQQRTSYSIGGGFVTHDDADEASAKANFDVSRKVPFPFSTSTELLAHCAATGKSIVEIALANETVDRSEDEVRARLLEIYAVMEESKNNSLQRTGNLPGGLNTRRRAPSWYRQLRAIDTNFDFRYWVEWVNLVALAVNEENASGGRIVTAPTNGAAGIVPAALFYATHYTERALACGNATCPEMICDFLLAAGAIGAVIKEQSSISGAEVGCQGEVGSASSMAAAGVAQILGASPEQVTIAAEIAMEHHLGLTCDPIGGLVQVPCIERNAIAATTAINAAKMAVFDTDEPMVTLDQVIRTMKATGADMSEKYKETAEGGLAVNVVAC